ncbi:MAG TPA: glycosyltransferase family 4 protein [Candidatus Baltobacteraceae bacterium]|nr:glycosyltransferase family 4 protein [Candidatus Baltobacteraceae bacterium]
MPIAPRVVHVVANLKEGGAEVLVRALCTRMERYGIDTAAVCVYSSNLSAEEKRAFGVPVIEIGRKGRMDAGFFPRLIDTLRSLRPAIVHGHISTGKYAGRIAALLAGVPHLVFTEHGDVPYDELRKLVNRVLHARTDRFIVFSDAQRTDLIAKESIPAERVSVIPNGIDLSRLSTDSQGVRAELGIDDATLLFFIPARIIGLKNIPLAIEALASRERFDGHPWMLAVAGRGPDLERCQALVTSLGVGERVRFLGFRDDVSRLMHAADVFLIPSQSESMPLTLGEAMLARTLVVSSPWPYARSFINDGETGFISDGFSSAAFARTVERALGNPQRRADILATAENFARATFDIELTARRHADLYREILGLNP